MFDFSSIQSITIPEGDVLSITDGNGTVIWEKKKKDPYTFVEYIQGTGTQYIDTGLLHTNLGEKYSINMEIDTLAQQNILFSNANDVAVNLYVQSNTRGTMYARYGQTSYSSRTNINPTTYAQKSLWKLENNYLYRNGSSIMNPTRASSIPTQHGTLKLLTSDRTSCTSGKIYEFIVERSGFPSTTTTMDLIPAIRNSDGEVGMYDQINDVFYANAGSGDFIAGPPV